MLTALQAGRCGLPDPDQLQFATSQDRVLTTFDADYLMLAAAGTPHTGIAYCPATKYTVGQLIQVLVLLHGVLSRTDMHNHVEYL